MTRQLIPLLVSIVVTGNAFAQPPLDYLNRFCDPYYPGTDFPKLITPQWVGEPGVDAVITLGIDDMRDSAPYAAYLQPILDRLQRIDGRAPVSIFTCSIDPQDEQLQRWLRAGLSLEVHTIDHPCPCLQNNNFAAARSTIDRCVDLMSSIPGNQPVAFRFPCCDSQNTPSPRAYAEILNQTTAQGNFVQASSSVVCLFTADDPQLPSSLTLDADGIPRFGKYIPFPSFVNQVVNYPYPYLIDRLCWEFPITTPDDWQGQNLNQPNNPQTVQDLIAAVDATVIKQGIANIVFHPHGWIRNDQLVQVIDHVQQSYGPRVKFLTFAECIERINRNLLLDQPVRSSNGGDNGVRLLDLNDDGYLDVLIGNEHKRAARVWQADRKRWNEIDNPLLLTTSDDDGNRIDWGIRFGALSPSGRVDAFVNHNSDQAIYRFADNRFQRIAMPTGLRGATSVIDGIDQGVRLRDLDHDGISEVLVGNPTQQQIYRRSAAGRWEAGHSLPHAVVDRGGRDNGVRLADLNQDGREDLIYSSDDQSAVYLFDADNGGFTRVADGLTTFPKIAAGGANQGAWLADSHLWWQNERTGDLPDGVDRRSFTALLGVSQPPPRKIPQALQSFRLQDGFELELVAAEPLVRDPVALDWGDDGRLWVVEMADYPLGLDDRGQAGGRIRLLTDTDHDGHFDQSQIFLDGLSFPTGVMTWREGILISAAPDVLYARDTDGDQRADSVEVLYTGFGEGNQQHRVNGFAWGLDNWIYLANGDSGGKVRSQSTGATVDIRGRDLRIRPDTGALDAQTGQTQFGRHRDDHGNWFGCSNLIPVRHYVLADHYARRNRLWAVPALARDIAGNTNTQVFPVSRILSHWSDYVPPLPGQPHRFTSASGVSVYRDDHLGTAFRNNTFTCDAVMNTVHRRTLTPDGVTFVSRRPAGEEAREFLASTDPWFRPTTATTGPDGALWVTDMYRLIIEHPEWIDDELERKLFLRAGHDRGRIYRIRASGKALRGIPNWQQMSVDQWISALGSPNGRRRDTAHRLLVHRSDPRTVDPLRRIVADDANPLARLHALCVLDGMKHVDLATLSGALADDDGTVRRHAIRIAEQTVGDRRDEVLTRLVSMVDDPDPQVRLQLACSLGHWSAAAATDALAGLAVESADASYQRSAVYSSLRAETLGRFYQQIDRDPRTTRALRLDTMEMAARGEPRLAADILQSLLQNLDPQSQDASRWEALTRLLRQSNLSAEQLLTHQGKLQQLAAAQLQTLTAATAISSRVAALHFLASLPPRLAGDYRHRLVGLVDVRQPVELQLAAAESIDDQFEPPQINSLLERMPQLSPSIRTVVLDKVVSRSQHCQVLLSALRSQRIDRSLIGAAHRQQLINHENESIRSSAIALLAIPDREDRIKVVQRYRNQLSAGDSERGKRVFEQHCGGCHRLQGIGHPVGPDLVSIVNRSPGAMLTAILNPNQAVEDKYRAYRVLTVDGRVETGVIGEETSTTVVLIKSDGQRLTMRRDDIDRIRDTGVSLMPDGLEQEISPAQMSDLLAYLIEVELPSKSFTGNRPQTVIPSADGDIALTAALGRIYGPGIVFENRYGNVGYWHHPQARIEWSLRVPARSRYDVIIDFACAIDAAGNSFQFSIADQTLTGKVPTTGSWDYYRQRNIGTVELASGPARATFRSDGPIDGFLIDLRGIVLHPVD